MTMLTFRIGICGCSSLYSGKFQNRRIKVWGRYIYFEEIPISVDHSDAEIWRKRCHFFLDVNIYDQPLPIEYHVFIDRRSPRRGRWNSTNEFMPYDIMDSTSKKPPSVRVIREWIRRLVEDIPKEKRVTWAKMEVVR